MIEVDFIAGFVVCVLSFIAGLCVGRDLGPVKKRGHYEPIEHGNFDESESWLHPPPWKQKPPNVITIIRGPHVK